MNSIERRYATRLKELCFGYYQRRVSKQDYEIARDRTVQEFEMLINGQDEETTLVPLDKSTAASIEQQKSDQLSGDDDTTLIPK